MADSSPEVQEIIKQVQDELTKLLRDHETGTITIHCGRGDLMVEVVIKRKQEPVRFRQGKPVIKRVQP